MATEKGELTIIRVFNAPVEKVWEAWTTPEFVEGWWGPKGFTAPFIKIDFKVGGKYLYCMRGMSSPNGKIQDFWSTGVFREIIPFEKIVASDRFSDNEGNPVSPSYYGVQGDFPEEFIVTTKFEKVDETTKMTLVHEGPPEDEIELAKQGWNESLDKLEETLKKGVKIQKITPCLWFDSEAEEAAKFYVSIFNDSIIKNIVKYDESGSKASGRKKGSVMTVDFELEGMKFVALNGGPIFKFSPAISFVVNCKTQKEVDYLWKELSKEGKPNECGWLEDKFGVSWQIVPTILNKLLSDPDPVKSERVMKAMLKMKKLKISELEKAYYKK